MEALLPLAIAAATGVLALIAAEWTPAARFRRALRRAPRTDIADVPDHGACKIVGRIEYEGPPQTAPMTGRTCAIYDVLVTDRRGRIVAWASDAAPFRIVDDTGYAIVEPGVSRVAIVSDERARLGPVARGDERQQAFAQKHGLSRRGAYSYREAIIEQGEQVIVMGYATREPDPEGGARVGGYRDLPPMRLRIRGTRRAPVYISDIEQLVHPRR